ncbi:hypothetical protein H8E50_00085 [bacterium]|nr:hypothetical protein [bacterium]
MKKDHRNIAVVFGRLVEFEEKTSVGKKKYLQVQIECPNDIHGNVKIYGRIWHKPKIDSLLAELKNRGELWKGITLRFDGFMEQYSKEGQIKTNFTFYHWRPYKGDELRAAFTLRGEVKQVMPISDGDHEVLLYINRPAGGDYMQEEELVLFSEDDAGIAPLTTVKIKGVIAHQGEEDYFGESSGVFKPYILKVEEQDEI